MMIEIIQKIPILTTLLSAIFFYKLYHHWLSKQKPAYIFWWMIGVLCYGLGTLTEATVSLFGWTEFAFKSWYILGALLGGFPLAQGSVYLIFNKQVADRLMYVVVTIIITASILVISSPIEYSLVEPTRLTGKVLTWSKVRLISPIVNIYAFIFLVGGALVSAYKYSKDKIYKTRFIGNLLIAVGGLLPGIGGSFTRFGYTEVLYVTELIGIILIYLGYSTMRNDKSVSIYQVQTGL